MSQAQHSWIKLEKLCKYIVRSGSLNFEEIFPFPFFELFRTLWHGIAYDPDTPWGNEIRQKTKLDITLVLNPRTS